MYSSWLRELASCGYLVVSITHNDGSSDYSPYVGCFDKTLKFYEYQRRNAQTQVRIDEVSAIVDEITKTDRFTQFGPDW